MCRLSFGATRLEEVPLSSAYRICIKEKDLIVGIVTRFNWKWW